MVRVDRQRMVSGFYRDVTKPGRTWLKSHPSQRPDDKWNHSPYRELFYEAYHGICAYTLRPITIHDMEIDHFHPVSSHRNQSYVWKNYRLASGGFNKLKRDRSVADPFAVPPDACRLHLSTGEIYLNPSLSGAWASLLGDSIRILDLNEKTLSDSRARKYSGYLRNHDVQMLVMEGPYVACEMLRQGEIAEEDRRKCVELLHGLGFSWVGV